MRPSRPLLHLALACLLLSSCSSSPVNYVAPEGATARLVFSGPAWQASIREGPSCDNTMMVPREMWPGIRVKSGKRLYVEHGIKGHTQQCLLALSFVAKPETSYVSEFRADGNFCGMEIYRFEPDGRRVRDNTVNLERVSFPRPCSP